MDLHLKMGKIQIMLVRLVVAFSVPRLAKVCPAMPATAAAPKAKPKR